MGFRINLKRRNTGLLRSFSEIKDHFIPKDFSIIWVMNGTLESSVRKGFFGIASHPDEAMNWSQAGGSLRADGAGVWWASMSFDQRIAYHAYQENIQ